MKAFAPMASLLSLPAGRSRGAALTQLALQCVLFGALYGIAARIGLAYSSLAPNVTLIWPPTGLALFVVLRWGPRYVPGIVLGDLIANAGTGAPLLAILGITAGNIAQAVLCLWALRRLAFDSALGRVRDVLALLMLGTVAAAVSALIGPAALVLGGTLDANSYTAAALQWWMGDATGVVVIGPLLLAWWRAPAALARGARTEAALLLLLLALLCEVVFVGSFSSLALVAGNYPAALALFPLVVWAALRFGLRGATLVTFLVSVAAIWGTVHGTGPLLDAGQTGSLVRWWVFANLLTVTGLVLAASQNERDYAQAQAIRDRDFTRAVLDAEGALVVVLDAEGRIQRVNRSFEQITGFSRDELVGKLFEEAVIPQEQHAKVRGHAELLRLKLSDSARLESPLRRRSGPPVTVSWTANALRDEQQRMTHSIVSGVDVSARIEATAALRQARRQLETRVAERTQALADANTALKQEMSQRLRIEQELIDISESEQQRFGRELHDGLGQHLTATAIQAELLARDLESAGQPLSQQSAQNIEAMLSEAVAQTRLLAQGLYPMEIEAGGLAGALQHLASATTRQTRRECTLHCPEPVEATDHAGAVHLYRIAQEAVNNASKHSEAGPIAIALTQESGALKLHVRSNLDAQALAADADGLGLRIMRHRAHLMGAEVQTGPVGSEWIVSVQ
jgi:PAS domain S-box-containing protein